MTRRNETSVFLGSVVFALIGMARAAGLAADPSARIEAPSAQHVPADAYNRALAGGRAGDLCRNIRCDVPPLLREGRAPSYPASALRAGIKGRAAVRFDIDVEGRPVNVVVHSATAEAFGIAASDAVKAWEFTPAILDGKPVAYEPVLQVFPFELPY